MFVAITMDPFETQMVEFVMGPFETREQARAALEALAEETKPYEEGGSPELDPDNELECSIIELMDLRATVALLHKKNAGEW